MKGYASLWPLLLLLPTFAYFFCFTEDAPMPAEMAHLALTRALLEQGSVRIGEQLKAHSNGATKVVVDGEAFSDQSPGLAFFSVPALAAAEVVSHLRGRTLSDAGALLWLRLVMCALPQALFFLWLHLFLCGLGTRPLAARAAAVSGALSLPLYFSATVFGGEALSAMLIVSSWFVLSASEDWPGPMRFSVAGGFAAAAIATSDLMLIPLLVLGGYALTRARRPRWVAPFFALVALGLIVTGAYRFACFGSPFTFPIQAGGAGLWESWHPAGGRLLHLLFAPQHGLFTVAPLWVFVVIGFVAMISHGDLGNVLFFGALVGTSALVASGVRATSEPLTALRLLAPLAVFSMVPLARGFEAAEAVATGPFVVGLLSSVSILIAALFVPYLPLLPKDGTNDLRDFVWPLLKDGVLPPNFGHWLGMSGLWALLPFVLLLSITLYVAAAGGVAHEGSAPRRVLAVVLFAGSLLLWRTSWQRQPHETQRFLQVTEAEQVLTKDGAAETVFAREAKTGDPIAKGVEATSRGDNAAALRDYRPLFLGP